MSDIETMIKALRLACIPRLLTPEIRETNWSLNFLLRCNYDVKYIHRQSAMFYKNILTFFNKLKNLYCCDGTQDMVIFNNKVILI